MSSWLILPRDPLIFRDGKPFTATPGERSKSMVFPFPSTIAGAVRTLEGTDTATGRFNSDRVGELLGRHICGPVLVSLDANEDIENWYLPAPSDALLIEAGSGEAMRCSLSPIRKSPGTLSDLEELSLVGVATPIKEKPVAKHLLYWDWKHYEEWLEKPTDGKIMLNALGIYGPQSETRSHVSIDPQTQTALPGALFQTSGIEFVHMPDSDEAGLSNARSLGLLIETDANLQVGVGYLGGERRIVRWQKVDARWPDVPLGVKTSIVDRGLCRLILASPAQFEQGFVPTWLQNEFDVEIVAAAVARYQTISGWDYKENRPKPTRRLAAAGSTYFLKLPDDRATRGKFIDAVWMNSISDDEQFRRDGFGLALLGSWEWRT